MMMKLPLFLLTMGVGYFVVLKATEEVGFLKHLGNLIASVMIIGSLLGMGLAGYFCYKSCGLGFSGKCPVQSAIHADEPK